MIDSEFESWVRSRNLYSYIPAKLTKSENSSESFVWGTLRVSPQGPKSKDRSTWGSSLQLDSYHQQLLLANSDEDLLLGFSSVVFWGYASGTDGIVRPARAMGKVRVFRDGRAGQAANSMDFILTRLKYARDFAKDSKFCEALLELMEIKHIGMSFASKLIMFMNPNSAAVYDSVIAERLSKTDKLDAMYISTSGSSAKHKIKQSDIYGRWCEFCTTSASKLNESGLQWTDWNADLNRFRAVDVERAFFSLGR